jgi:hypothetical protein
VADKPNEHSEGRDLCFEMRAGYCTRVWKRFLFSFRLPSSSPTSCARAGLAAPPPRRRRTPPPPCPLPPPQPPSPHLEPYRPTASSNSKPPSAARQHALPRPTLPTFTTWRRRTIPCSPLARYLLLFPFQFFPSCTLHAVRSGSEIHSLP